MENAGFYEFLYTFPPASAGRRFNEPVTEQIESLARRDANLLLLKGEGSEKTEGIGIHLDDSRDTG